MSTATANLTESHSGISEADSKSLDLIYRNARTQNGWLDKQVDKALLTRVYDLMKWGPTSSNCCPLRIVFVTTDEAKEKLKPCLAAPNVNKTITAPVTAIFANDMEFYEKLPVLSPKNNARSWFVGEGKEKLIETTAFRNGTLQTAYFMLAARALGLDCAPMSGFDNAKVDAAFFAGTPLKSNFICSLGYGDTAKVYPRGPRLEFGEVCRVE